MHLRIAEQLRSQAAPDSAARELLEIAWPAFLLGSVAPDCQSVADLSRETTHFYRGNPGPEADAYALILERYPELRMQTGLPVDHAAFVVAYCIHLLYDVDWFRQILIPHFAAQDYWPSHQERFLAHNSLLIYLDQLALQALAPDTELSLRAAEPDHWLPFVPDDVLTRWRDVVASQLAPGADIQTVAVYARRLKLSPAAYAANLADPEWMASIIFDRVPLATVSQILDDSLARSLVVMERYLAGAPIYVAAPGIST